MEVSDENADVGVTLLRTFCYSDLNCFLFSKLQKKKSNLYRIKNYYLPYKISVMMIDVFNRLKKKEKYCTILEILK